MNSSKEMVKHSNKAREHTRKHNGESDQPERTPWIRTEIRGRFFHRLVEALKAGNQRLPFRMVRR